MALSSTRFYEGLNLLLGPANIQVTPVDPSYLQGEDGFFINGLACGPITLILPHWEVQEWKHGFGGWVICGGSAIRFVRQRLAHTNIPEIINELVEIQHVLGDVNIPEVEALVAQLLEPDGFYFQAFEDQLVECVISALFRIGTGTSKASIDRAAANFCSAVTKWLNAFPSVANSANPGETSKTKFLQDQIVVGFPEVGVPIGTEVFFKNAMVKWLHETPKHHNVWGTSGFRACVACTSKSNAGEWVTMVPPTAHRVSPTGEYESALDVPLMIAASCPIGYNPKRVFREGNALKNAWRLATKSPIVHGIKNGFECHLGQDLEDRIAEVTVLFAGIQNVNLYSMLEANCQPEEGEDGYLNLDDINKTPRGHARLRTEYRREWHFPAEEWPKHVGEFMENGKLKPGYELHPDHTYQTTAAGMDLYTSDMTVLGPIGKDRHIVSKCLVNGSHKAMTKRIRCELQGRDTQGKVYDIDLVISGHSMREKKLQHVTVGALAGRAGIQYWEDFTGAIHEDREALRPEEDPETWAKRYPDLVQETYVRLKDQGEDPLGLIDIYAREPAQGDLENWTHWQYVGQGLVGYARASVLWENEHSGSKARASGAVPYAMFLRHLADRPLELDEDTQGHFNHLASVSLILASAETAAGESYSLEV